MSRGSAAGTSGAARGLPWEEQDEETAGELDDQAEERPDEKASTAAVPSQSSTWDARATHACRMPLYGGEPWKRWEAQGPNRHRSQFEQHVQETL